MRREEEGGPWWAEVGSGGVLELHPLLGIWKWGAGTLAQQL